MKFGIKVVDKTSTKNKKRLNKYLNYYKQLDACELAIYNKSDDYIKELKYHIFHTETKEFSIEKLLYKTDELYYYINEDLLPLLKKENISNIVVHILPDKGIEKYNNKEIKKFIEFCSTFSERENINIFLENTYDSVLKIKDIFNMDKNNKLNFCFDIGHAKALSKEDSFSDWLNFIKDFKNNIHIHFHTNRGTKDEHLPLTSITNEFTSSFHEGKDYFQMAKELIEVLEKNEENSFIIETHSNYAKANIDIFKKLNLLK